MLPLLTAGTVLAMLGLGAGDCVGGGTSVATVSVDEDKEVVGAAELSGAMPLGVRDGAEADNADERGW